MRFVVIDFETLYGDDYTLSKMSTESYIRDPRFCAHGAALKFQANIPARWYPEKELRWVLANEDWSDTFMVCHHGQFDHAISAWHYDVHPKMLGDTLAMARLLIGNHTSVSLDSVRKHFGFPPKTTPYHAFRGKTWEQLTPAEQEALADGCCDEVESIWKIFGLLHKDFPASQYEAIDIMLRMFCEPVLVGDLDLFGKIWEAESKRKTTMMQHLGMTETELQSADRFADLLRERGVEPATKSGKDDKDGNPRSIYAFAKTDDFMKDLLEDDDEEVRALAEVRLGVKSNILQTRAETLGWMTRRGPLAVYLRIYGARTTRPAGGDGSNFLNFKKIDPDMPVDLSNASVKQAMAAPSGYLLAEIDNSQIQCRLVNFIAGQDDVIARFRNGEDPYVNVASQFYGYPVNKKDHPTQRQAGKVIELQAGFGSGGEKIRATLRNKAKIIITPAEGVAARDAYRDTHPAVVDLWKQGGRMIARLAGGDPCDWGPVHIRDKRMWLPNGCPLIYDTLEYHRPEGEEREIASDFDRDGYWRVKTRKGYEKLYGAKLVADLCQSLDWTLTTDAMMRITRLSYRVLSTTYDSLLLLIPRDGKEQEHLERCKAEFRYVPPWLAGIPLDCEGDLSTRWE